MNPPLVDVLWDSQTPEDTELISRVIQWAQTLLNVTGSSERSLSIVLCDDALIEELNSRWRDVAGPTDVLSFPMDEGEVLAIGDAPSSLGDVVISLETSARQAPEHGYTLHEELRLLLVHGLCHLLGHDHGEPDEAAAMRTLEEALLSQLDPSQTRPNTFY